MRAILEIGLGNAAIAAVLALLAWAVGRWCRRPAVVHAVWVLVLVKLVTPPLRTLPLGGLWARRPVSPVAQSPARTVPQPEPLAMSPVMRDAALPTGCSVYELRATFDASLAALAATPPPVSAPAEAVRSLARPVEAPAPVVHPAASAASAAPVRQLNVAAMAKLLPDFALAVWGAGSAWCVVAVLVRVRRFRALVRCGTTAPPSVLAQVRCLCDQFGLRRPTCTMMPGDICPMVYGLFGRNRLLIPISLWERLMPSQQVSLLTHELAHLHRGDHWVRALEVVATVLYWWHPATWWARREVREAEEQCCDAWVGRLLPGSAAAYASALLDAVEFMSAKPTGSKGRRGSVAVAAATPAWASGLSEFQSLKRRLLMITSPSRVSPKLSAASLAAVLSLAGLSLPLSPVLAQTSTTPPAADVAPAEPTPAPRPKPVRAAPSVAPVAPAAQAAPAPTPAPAAVPDGDEARIIAGLRAQAGTTPIPAGTPSSSAATALPGDPFGTTAEERPGTPFAMPADPTDMKRDSQSTAANARRMAQLQRAQADVKRLSAELEAATRRLKDLEQATQSADMGKRAAEEGKRAAEMGKRAAEDAKRRAEDGKRAAEDAKRWAEDGKRSAEASKRAMDKWKMKQDTKLWKEGTTPDQPSGQPGEPNFGPVIINPPPGIGVHGNQYKEVTIRADGMPQIEVRELPRVSASEGVVGQPGTMPMPALRELAKNRNEELEQRLANLDRQLAELSGQVAALRGELKHQTAGPTKAPQPRER